MPVLPSVRVEASRYLINGTPEVEQKKGGVNGSRIEGRGEDKEW
jgi:hypothetical protein